MRSLILWIGLDPIPQWRYDFAQKIKAFHPEIEIDFEWIKRKVDRPDYMSDGIRKRYCGNNKYRLWIDSDIELLAPLPLGEDPFLADENGPHLSIVWSGNNPDLIRRRNWTYTYNKIKKFVKPDGLYRHWQMGANGEKLPRTDLGYRPEDFVQQERSCVKQ